MTSHPQHPYSGISPEELHVIMRRAHAERATAIRELFAALLAWRRKGADRRQATHTALRTAGSH